MNYHYALLVVWRDGSSEYLREGATPAGRVAIFTSESWAREQRAFMLEGIADEVQSINVVLAPESEVTDEG